MELKDMQKDTKRRRLLSPSNLITGLLLVLVLAIWIFPDIKSGMIRGLMKVGLFQPDIPDMQQHRSPVPAEIGATAFRMEQGAVLTLNSLRGKVVFLNFWATWCPPCRAELPSIQQLYRKFQADPDVVFLMVDADGQLERSRAFLQQNGYELPLALPEGAIPEALFGGTLPTTLILDKEGQIVYRETGAADYGSKKMEQFLLRLK